MKISTKLGFSFSIICILILLILFSTLINTSKISEENLHIQKDVKTAKNEFYIYEDFKEIDSEINYLIRQILKVGYDNDSESLNNTLTEYSNRKEKTISLISNTSADNLNEKLTLIDDCADRLFKMKQDEISFEKEIEKNQTEKEKIKMEITPLQKEINDQTKVDIQKVTNFKDSATTLRDKYYDEISPSDEILKEIHNKLTEYGIENLSLYETETLWEFSFISMDLKNFAALKFNARELISNSSSIYLPEIEKIVKETLDYIKLQTKYGYSMFDPVLAVLIEKSLENYKLKASFISKKISELNNFKKQMQAIELNSENLLFKLSEISKSSLKLVNEEFTPVLNETLGIISQNNENKKKLLEENLQDVTISADHSLESVETTKKVISAVTITVIVTCLILSIFILKNLKKSIVKVTDKAEKLKNLNLNISFEELENRKDEISIIESSLKNITTSFRDSLQEVEKASQNIYDNLEELNTLTEKSETLSENITRGAQKTDSNIQNTSANMEEITSELSEVSNSAKNLVNVSGIIMEESHQTSLKADEGEKKLNSVNGLVKNAYTQTENTKEIMARLSEKSKNVEEIVHAISGISEQTNLLALNAAIEAARAGEAGKGFAVVSDEIRKLAEESKNSTAQISQILKEIENETKSASQATNVTYKIISEVNTGSNDAYLLFKDIRSLIADVSEKMETLYETVKTQFESTNEVLSAVEQSSILMVDTSQQIEEISSSIEKQANQIRNINNLSETLGGYSKSLKKLVDKFTI